MSALAEIERTVLALPVEQRVSLVETILGSLPTADDEWSENEEMAEVERRERQFENGQAKPLNESEFWRSIEAGRTR